MNRKYYSIAFAILLASNVNAQDLKTEISVSHEIIPEERSATRLRILPSITLPTINPGRLASASSFYPSAITPSFNILEPADYLLNVKRSPFKGYAELNYGPIYNLNASAGYRFFEKSNFCFDGYMQFNGMSYDSRYTKFEHIYSDKVNIHRNTALIGGNTYWRPKGVNGELTAAVMYQFSAYNFPILMIPQPVVNSVDIFANQVKVDARWSARIGNVDYAISGNYNMIAFAKDKASNGGKLNGSVKWKYSDISTWALDLGASVVNSTIVGYKGIVNVKPKYIFSNSHVSTSVGVNFDLKTGNCAATRNFVIAPDIQVNWKPLSLLSVWANINGKMLYNNRVDLYNEQAYLLPEFDAGFSRLYIADAGVTFGPWHGLSAGLYGGYVVGKDWYMPGIITGEMDPINIQGAHGGVSLTYDYKRFLSINVKADLAQSPDGNFNYGYAFWRDHAMFNLMAQVKIRPIKPLEIGVCYHLRTNRSKVLVVNYLDLQNINNLSAKASYAINSQWSAFVNIDNILNQKWYLGPSMPSQGIVAMLGGSFKF